MAAPNEDMEMEKIAEDELSKLHRQYRIMEIDRGAVTASARPTLRMQRNLIRTLHRELDEIMLELKLTKSPCSLMEHARCREQLVTSLRQHEVLSAEVRQQKSHVAELDFLLRQVEKEIKSLQSRGSRSAEDFAKTMTNQSMICQLENRLDTAVKKFNAVNTDNYQMRVEIDKLLRDRQSFNLSWRTQIKQLSDGKAQILELVEQAIATYDQREEWCAKLEALKERAAIDYRKHCLEVRELQRQLDHSLKLEEFLRTKGTVRLTAADAKAEAKRLERQEEEQRTYNNYVNILEALKEFTGDSDVDKLIQEFTRREEENYALFNYINEVNAELKHLHDNVGLLKTSIRDEFEKHEAKKEKEQDTLESLQNVLDEKRAVSKELETEFNKSSEVLQTLLVQIHHLAKSSDCETLPLLRLLGKAVDVNVSNARLFIKSLEKKILEMVEVINIDEKLIRLCESKERTPPSSRRRPRAPRRSPRAPALAPPLTPHTVVQGA